jgi:hypothetical protein
VAVRPSVSILIPSYDAEAWIGEAIESALSQTCTDAELLVVDDGSRDDTASVLKSFGARIRWETGPHRGAPAARNRLLDLARGDWLQYLDADDVLLPTKVERQLEAAAGSDLVVSPYLTEAGAPRSVAEGNDPWLAFLRGRMGVTSSTLFRREALRKAGGWEEDRCAAQEAELVRRMLCMGARVVFVPAPLCIKRRVNRQSLWRSAWRDDPEAASRANVSAVAGAVEYLRQAGELSAAREAAAGARFLLMARGAQRAGADAEQVLRAARELGLRDSALLSAATRLERVAYRVAGISGVERATALRPRGRRRVRAWRRAAKGLWRRGRRLVARLRAVPLG